MSNLCFELQRVKWKMKCRGIIISAIENRLIVEMNKIGKRNVNETYIINYSNQTKLNCKISDLTKGSLIEIHFNGIVALSMPPQIYATRLIKN